VVWVWGGGGFSFSHQSRVRLVGVGWGHSVVLIFPSIVGVPQVALIVVVLVWSRLGGVVWGCFSVGVVGGGVGVSRNRRRMRRVVPMYWVGREVDEVGSCMGVSLLVLLFQVWGL